jgi:hypothetical protein
VRTEARISEGGDSIEDTPPTYDRRRGTDRRPHRWGSGGRQRGDRQLGPHHHGVEQLDVDIDHDPDSGHDGEPGRVGGYPTGARFVDGPGFR